MPFILTLLSSLIVLVLGQYTSITDHPLLMSPEFSEMPQQGQIQFSGAVDDTLSWGSIPFLPCFFMASLDNRLVA